MKVDEFAVFEITVFRKYKVKSDGKAMIFIAMRQEYTGNGHISQNKETNGIQLRFVSKPWKEFFDIFFMKLQKPDQVAVFGPDLQNFEYFFFRIYGIQIINVDQSYKSI